MIFHDIEVEPQLKKELEEIQIENDFQSMNDTIKFLISEYEDE